MTIRTIDQVVARHLCTGCGGCAAAAPAAIQMTDAADGFRRPKIRVNDEAAMKAARAVCPGLGMTARGSHTQEWGPVLEIWEGYASDPAMRRRGSSGGIVAALSAFAITRQDHAGAVMVRARKDAPLLNESFIARNTAEIASGQGSRYAPASPADKLAGLTAARHVFTGKPCDVQAAAQLAATNPEIAGRIGLTISIFCAGTPGTAGVHALARRLGAEKPEDVAAIRYRGEGWPGTMQALLRRSDGTATPGPEISYAEGWGGILQKYRQWRCHVCVDHTGEFADISVGDPWDRPAAAGTDDPGRSLVVLRTERGRAMFHAALAEGAIIAERREADAIGRAQPNLAHARRQLFGRLAAMRLMGLSTPRYRGFKLLRLWLMETSLREKIQSLAGTVKRVMARRLWQPPLA